MTRLNSARPLDSRSRVAAWRAATVGEMILTQRDEELQALGYRDQRGGDQPGVLAGTSGGDQYAAEAQAVGGLGDLLQVAVVDGTGALGGAQVVAVAVGGKEPENLEAHRN